MKTFRTFALACIGSLLLVACGGGGGSDANQSSANVTPATVSLVITDASIDEWDQALTTITSVELIGETDRHQLFTGERTVDLLRLRDFVEVFEIDDQVRPGTYSKIRLQVSRMQLVRLNDDGSVEEQRDADLVANGKIDLNPRDSINIDPGAVLFITLDFDMEKSFKLTETGNGKLKVRPVIFVRIDTTPGFRRLARVQGRIERIGDNYDGFVLCRTQLVAVPLSENDDSDSDGDRARCFRVATDADTGAFGEDGLPADLLGLMEGDPVTVVGRLSRRMDEPDVEAISNSDDDADTDDDGRPVDPFVLHAFVIEKGLPGTWRRIAGEASTAVVDDSFSVAVDPAQGFAPDTVINALLTGKSRIFTPRGAELDRNAIQAGERIVADAVLALSEVEPDALRTALVVVGNDTPRESLEGELLSIDNGQLTIATPSGDRCVLTADATILRIGRDDLDIEEISVAELETGQRLETFGGEGTGGCFAADVVIAQATSPAL